MLMVIFGAGASYDSAPSYPPNVLHSAPNLETWRPPLAKDLFADRHHAFGAIVDKYPKLTHVLPSLRQPSNGRSVEQVLESYQLESANPETARELASVRFYLRDLFHKITEQWSLQTNGVTNYAPLIREALRYNRQNEPILLVTFNYDMLLERALYTFDFKPRMPEEQFESHPILKLFNLHGSIGWVRLTELGSDVRMTTDHLIGMADSLRISDKFILGYGTNERELQQYSRPPVFPAIAIPVQTKTNESFECPLSLRKKLIEMLSQVTKILIIGWQAKEAHFLGMLREGLSKEEPSDLFVVGANEQDAKQTFEYFTNQIKRDIPAWDRRLGKGGFTRFVVAEEGQNFLRA